MVITVFGLGFVGLTTALGFCEFGHKVYGVELDEIKLHKLKNGTLPFVEPGMDEALHKHLDKAFSPINYDDLEKAVNESDAIFYCVGTPYGKDGSADLHFLKNAVKDTLSRLRHDKFRVLVVKSTVPPSTASSEVIPFIESLGWHVRSEIGVGSNPEFLREGHCWQDFMKADRIVLGSSDSKTEALLKQVYANTGFPVFSVTLNTAEFIKYLSNTLLANLISFSNEMANTAEAIGGIQIKQAFDILRMDKRWGDVNMKSYVYPGCGYGGYCLPKDTNAFYALSERLGHPAKMLKEAIKVNDEMPAVIARRIEAKCGSSKDSVIGILGLSFKPESDDVRDTPSAKIIQKLISDGYKNINVYDPLAIDNFKKAFKYDINFCFSRNELLDKSNVAVILTAWDEFKSIKSTADKPLLDFRYMN